MRSARPFEPVVRERVLARFDEAAAYRVVLVTAPAGFGKSVAVRHYLERRKIEHVRCGLRRGDGTLLTFLGAFAASLERVAPNMVHAYSNFYTNVEESPTIVLGIAQWMAAMLKSFRGTIFVDDVHYAREDPRVGELLLELVERTGPDVRWIFAARDPQVLPVATWLAYGVCDVPIDEADLRLTNDEAAATARACDVALAPPVLEHVLSLTDGWATAFAFALRAFERTSELGRVTHGTREMVYAFLAEQVFRSLDLPDREFLMRTSPLPALDLRILAESHFNDPQATIERLRGTTSFIIEESEGVYRYHDLFRDFLDHELRRDNAAFADAYNDAATWLHRAKVTSEALKLYRDVKNQDAIVAILEAQGADLFDRGEVQSLESIIDELPNERVESSPLVLTLRAMIKAFRYNFDATDSMFERALEQVVDLDTRAHILMRFAITMSWRWQPGTALDKIGEITDAGISSASLRSRFMGFKAYLMSCVGVANAGPLVSHAMDIASETSDIALQSQVLQYAALVSIYERRLDDAKRFGKRALELAELGKRFGLAGRLAMLLASVANEVGDDEESQLNVLRMRRYADQIGDKVTIDTAAMMAYCIFTQNGDVVKLKSLEFDLDNLTTWVTRANKWPLLQAPLAMQHAWAGCFSEAFEVINGSAAFDTNMPDSKWRNLLRSAEIALFAAAAGENSAAEIQIAKFVKGTTELRSDPILHSFEMTKSQVILSLAMVLLGQSKEAHSLLKKLERRSQAVSASLLEFIVAVRALQIYLETNLQYSKLFDAIDALGKTNLAGYAKLMSALPISELQMHSKLLTLTPTEFQVLASIAQGGSSKDVGARLGRSSLTVDTHVRSIVKKLGCSGRHEAITFARERGLL